MKKMKYSKKTDLIAQFFKDSHGHWVNIQFPSPLLIAWVVLLFVNFFLHDKHVQLLQTTVLFVWAYLELTQGSSYFRKTLGAIVLAVIVIGSFR